MSQAMSEQPKITVHGFMAFLEGKVLPPYQSHFRKRADAFLSHCERLSVATVERRHVESYLDWQRRLGAPAQELRNRRIVCEAILAYAEHLTSEATKSDQRRAPRVAFVHALEVEGLGGCRALDVSVGGMFVESSLPLQPQTVLGLRFRLGGRPISSLARVVHAGSQGAGVAFLDLTERDRNIISDFVTAKRAHGQRFLGASA